jgi:hypothetical protein
MLKNTFNIIAIFVLVGISAMLLINVNPSVKVEESNVLGASSIKYKNLSLQELCGEKLLIVSIILGIQTSSAAMMLTLLPSGKG